MAASSAGPLWFRGLAEEPEDKLMEGVKAMLARLQAQYIVIGHTVASKADVIPRFESRVFLLDTGMLRETYGGRGSALDIQNGRFTVQYADGDARAIAAPSSGKTGQPGR